MFIWYCCLVQVELESTEYWPPTESGQILLYKSSMIFWLFFLIFWHQKICHGVLHWHLDADTIQDLEEELKLKVQWLHCFANKAVMSNFTAMNITLMFYFWRRMAELSWQTSVSRELGELQFHKQFHFPYLFWAAKENRERRSKLLLRRRSTSKLCACLVSKWTMSENICHILEDKCLLFFQNKGTNRTTFEIRFSGSPLAVSVSVISMVRKSYFQHVQANIMCVFINVKQRVVEILYGSPWNTDLYRKPPICSKLDLLCVCVCTRLLVMWCKTSHILPFIMNFDIQPNIIMYGWLHDLLLEI